MHFDPAGNEELPDIEIEPADPLGGEAVALLAALDDQLNARCGPERNHGSPPARLARPDVSFFVARQSGKAVGCAALQIESDGSGEVKRMYVTPETRGRGVGQRLLMRVEREARRAKLRVLRLETSPPLHEAIALYRRCGFIACPAFGPYVSEPINLYFEKSLSERPLAGLGVKPAPERPPWVR